MLQAETKITVHTCTHKLTYHIFSETLLSFLHNSEYTFKHVITTNPKSSTKSHTNAYLNLSKDLMTEAWNGDNHSF